MQTMSDMVSGATKGMKDMRDKSRDVYSSIFAVCFQAQVNENELKEGITSEEIKQSYANYMG